MADGKLLEIDRLEVRYGRNHALKRFSLALEAGEIVTVLGANGAGKSSLLKAILGLVRPAAGRVHFAGEEITTWTTPRRIRNGLVMVPEGRQILVSLSVHENLQMGAWPRRDDFSAELDAIYSRFPNLAERRNMMASVLSGGEQQMLAISRALLAKPRLMMLDEPSLGLSPRLVSELFALIRDLHGDGLSMLLVEQNTAMALKVAQRGVVLELGRTVAQGRPAELSASGQLEAAYLGSGEG